MAATRRKKTSCKKGFWFMTGFVCAGVMAGLFWWKFLAPQAQTAAGARVVGKKSTTRPGPRFTYQNILPAMEVVVSEAEASPAPVSHKPVKKPVRKKEADRYLLQIGSFRRAADADRQKANLALLGIEARIERVSINNKDTWHRVRSGPYVGLKKLNSIRGRLKASNINSIVIKLKPSA